MPEKELNIDVDKLEGLVNVIKSLVHKDFYFVGIMETCLENFHDWAVNI